MFHLNSIRIAFRLAVLLQVMCSILVAADHADGNLHATSTSVHSADGLSSASSTVISSPSSGSGTPDTPAPVNIPLSSLPEFLSSLGSLTNSPNAAALVSQAAASQAASSQATASLANAQAHVPVPSYAAIPKVSGYDYPYPPGGPVPVQFPQGAGGIGGLGGVAGLGGLGGLSGLGGLGGFGGLGGIPGGLGGLGGIPGGLGGIPGGLGGIPGGLGGIPGGLGGIPGGLGGIPGGILGGIPGIGFGKNAHFGLDVDAGFGGLAPPFLPIGILPYFPIVEKVIVIVGGGILLLVIVAIIKIAIAKGGFLNKLGLGLGNAFAALGSGSEDGSVSIATSAAGSTSASFSKSAALTQRVTQGIDREF